MNMLVVLIKRKLRIEGLEIEAKALSRNWSENLRVFGRRRSKETRWEWKARNSSEWWAGRAFGLPDRKSVV